MRQLPQRLAALLREKSRLDSAILFFLVLFLASQASITVVLQPVGTAEVLALQTTLSAEDFRARVADLHARHAINAYIGHYYYDFLHPLWYAGLLALLLGRAFDRQAVPATRNGWLLLPLLAGALDLVENSLHLYMVLDSANITALRVWLANGAALLKWAIAGGVLIAAAVLFLRRPRNAPPT